MSTSSYEEFEELDRKRRAVEGGGLVDQAGAAAQLMLKSNRSSLIDGVHVHSMHNDTDLCTSGTKNNKKAKLDKSTKAASDGHDWSSRGSVLSYFTCRVRSVHHIIFNPTH